MDDADSERQGGGAAGGQEIYRAAEAAAFQHHLDAHAQQSQQIDHNGGEGISGEGRRAPEPP